MNPTISVIMPVYNAGAYLKDSIASILSQTFKDFEFMIVNDGSSDASEGTILGFSDPRIVYIKNEKNIGQTASMNKAIKAARGKYIARMDADDVSFSERFKEQFEYAEKNERVAVIGTWHQEIDESGRVIRRCRFPSTPDIKARLIFSKLAGWPIISHPTVMIRKKVLDEVGYYDANFRICQDYDLWLRITRKYPAENIGKVLLSYRVHGSSLTKKFRHETKKEYDMIISNNLGHDAGGLAPEEREGLRAMLCNEPQNSKADIKRLLTIFDDYFSAVLSEELHGPSADDYRCLQNHLKTFYAPQLMKTHMIEALQLLSRALFRYPSILFSRRFMRSIKNSLS